jgi:two-component system, chemotaxis family, response regulator PixG
MMHRIVLANRIHLGRYRFSQAEDHLSLLERIAVDYANGHVQIYCGSRIQNFSIFLQEGKIIYGCMADSNMWKIFDSKLQALSKDSSLLNLNVYNQIKNVFETASEDEAVGNPGYLAICWLVNERYINLQEAQTLIEEIVLEVIRSLQKLKEAIYEFTPQSLLDDMPKFCYLDIASLTKPAEQLHLISDSNISGSHSENPLNPLVESDSESVMHLTVRSKIVESGALESETLELGTLKPVNVESDTLESRDEESGKTAKQAFEFEGIPTPFVNEDEKTQNVEVSKEEIYTIDEELEQVQKQLSRLEQKLLTIDGIDAKNPSTSQESNPSTVSKKSNILLEEKPTKVYKILCIDDSPTVLKAIKSFLDEQLFSVIIVEDPLKALMQILRYKPDIILLDISMPSLDGYELCSLLRKHRHFRDVPVVMVTGKTGFIDKARAKMVRASGYLTKPFTKADLLKVVFHQIGNITADSR